MSLLFYTLSIVTAGVTAGLYWLGVNESLFWVYPWYDIPIHILAGVMLGCWAAGSAAGRHMPTARMVAYVFFVVVTVGILWELFEYMAALTGGEPGFMLDVIADLVNDCLGGALPAILYWYLHRKKVLYV